VLPAPLRLRRSDDFARTIRKGARAGRETVVAHCILEPSRPDSRVGFVVSKAVGGAVVRNRVRRRMRGAVLEQRELLPSGADLVLRALPPSAVASYERIAADIRSATSTAARKAREGSSRR
jgi:ribonuclease P protein component